MAVKKTVEIDVNTKSLGQLEEMLEEVNKEIKDLDRNSDTFKEAAKKSQLLSKEIEKINNEVEGFNLDDKLQAADGAAKVFGGSLAAAVGTLGTLGIESEAFGEFEQKAASAIAVGLGIKDVSEGFGQVALAAKKSGIATKLFGTTTKRALVATGIGVFAVALGAIVNNWDSITKAVKRFANNVPFIGKAIDAVKDTFNNLFDAARPVLEFLGILPDEAERAAIETKKAVSNTISELEREIAIAQAAGAEAEKIYALRKQLIEAELQQLKDSNAEKEEIFKKETELLALEAAEQKRIRDGKVDTVKREKVQTVNEIEATGVKELEVDKKITGELLTNRNQLAKDEIKLEELTTESKMNLASNALGDLASVLGEESKAGKAAAIAQTTIETYKGATAAYASLAGVPIVGPGLGAIAAAAALAAGFKNIQAIQQQGPSVGGASSAPSATPRGSQSPSFNIVGAAPENQLAQAIGENNQKPVKAFVVSSEVSNQQALDRKIETGSSIG